jgi:alpha-galactosidase
MRKKVAFIGAGSLGFTRKLVRDILVVPELDDIDIAFTDIHKGHLDMVFKLCERDIRANGSKARLTATLDRRKALKGAHYVFNVVRIGGLDAFRTDIEIPLKYGIDQCVGDTLCAGGIMYAQRGIAAMLEFCKDIREVAAPGCIFFNYANPMAMNTWACNTYGGVRTVGLCHGVQGCHRKIAKVLHRPLNEVDVVAAGINHQTWFIRVSHKGKDMTGRLLKAFEADPHYSKTEKVRIDLLRRFGYFTTESNGHVSEYLPWYRKRPAEVRKWIHLGSWIDGETGGYLRRCIETRNYFTATFKEGMREPPWPFDPAKRSHEHGSFLLEGLETGRVYRGHFNVVNNGCISNLAPDAVVEVPGYVDRNGLNIPVVGDLPVQCAAVCSRSVDVQRMAVEAAVHGDDELLRQAMLMDPLVGAVCNPPEIWQLVDEMLVAQARWLPQYKRAIRAAAARLEKGPRLKTKPTKGVRLKTKTVSELRKAKAARA